MIFTKHDVILLSFSNATLSAETLDTWKFAVTGRPITTILGAEGLLMATDRILIRDLASHQAIPFIPNVEPLSDSTSSPWVGLKLQHYRMGGSERPDATTNCYLAAVCLGGYYKTEYRPGGGVTGVKIPWKQGGVFLTSPGPLPARRSTGNVECLVLEIAPKYILWAADEMAVAAPFQTQQLWWGKDDQLRYLMLALHQELLAKYPSGRLFGEYVGLSFGSAILTQSVTCSARACNRVGLPPYKLHQTIAFINDNLAEDLSLCELANLSHLTPAGFARAFKISTGVSPHQYILRRRIERALRVLKESPISLAALAYELGFCSQGHFTQVFQNMVGVSPGRYRESLLSRKSLVFPPVSTARSRPAMHLEAASLPQGSAALVDQVKSQ